MEGLLSKLNVFGGAQKVQEPKVTHDLVYEFKVDDDVPEKVDDNKPTVINKSVKGWGKKVKKKIKTNPVTIPNEIKEEII